MDKQTIKRNLRSADLKEGDTVIIEPYDRFPNADRELDFFCLTEEGILYHVTEYCDGYVMPYEWIRSFTVKKGDRV